jgi:hypothetical protein
MGTRSLICVFKDGEYKVAQYSQWDGYPEGQGLDILNFLRNEFDRELFESKLNMIRFGTNEELYNHWKECGAGDSEWVSMEVADKHTKLYPENSRDTGAKILSIIQNTNKPLILDNSLAFAADSLFCEWAYVIDLDKNIFEVYEGFNQEPLDRNERFSFLDYQPAHRTEKYYPVKLVATFDIDNLPTEEDFLNTFNYDEN